MEKTAYPAREVVRTEKEHNVVVVDDQYVSRSFFEIQVQMSKGYRLAASLSSAE